MSEMGRWVYKYLLYYNRKASTQILWQILMAPSVNFGSMKSKHY